MRWYEVEEFEESQISEWLQAVVGIRNFYTHLERLKPEDQSDPRNIKEFQLLEKWFGRKDITKDIPEQYHPYLNHDENIKNQGTTFGTINYPKYERFIRQRDVILCMIYLCESICYQKSEIIKHNNSLSD
jgi:hypothetical protein